MQYFLQLTKILKKKSVHHKTLTRPDLFISFSACVLFFMYSIHVYITVNIYYSIACNIGQMLDTYFVKFHEIVAMHIDGPSVCVSFNRSRSTTNGNAHRSHVIV